MKTSSRSLAACCGLAAASLTIVGATASTAVAQPAPRDPAGNNGTVKVAPAAEGGNGAGNTPHVKCSFDIAWYGFDADAVSTVELAVQAPTDGVVAGTGGPAEVFVGGDPAGGGTDFDGAATYTPDFTGDPDPEQGYHVKVTVHTTGSQGADTKSKVLWVAPCDTPPNET